MFKALKYALSACVLAIAGYLLGVGVAITQQQIAAGISGAEVVVIQQGGPGGSSIYTTTGRLTSGPAYAYFAAFPSSFTIGTLSGTVNTAPIVTGGALNINAANTAQTFTLPPTASLIDGEVINVCNVTAAAWTTNAVAVVANSNQTLVGSGTLTTLAASTCAGFQWVASIATWFRTSVG
jgi:hypothetical protein